MEVVSHITLKKLAKIRAISGKEIIGGDELTANFVNGH